MQLTQHLLKELQNRLKVGNRRGVHLNAIPARSRYKFDLHRLSHLDETLPDRFLEALLTKLPLKFRISWKDNVPDLNSLFEDDQAQLVRITKSFENLINQTEAIEAEKGINTFGFGFPLLVRRDQADNKLTVAPVLIWSLRIKRTKEFNTWVVQRTEDDPIYMNEVLINHLQNDAGLTIDKVSMEMLDDGLIDADELLDICTGLIESVNTSTPDDLRSTFEDKLATVVPIRDKKHYEKLPLSSTNAFIEFGGLFSIFEVQKQNIIHDYADLMDLEGMTIDLEDLTEHHFQPLSSVETDPSQQGILHALQNKRNLLIQGPPGTGKSQSLTAVLVNALENHKKTIVVCEKRTALEVLQKALVERGLDHHAVLIKDIVKDRRTVVDSVRSRIDDSGYKRYRYEYNRDTLDTLVKQATNLIDSINNQHGSLGERILDNHNWTNVVGMLLKVLREHNEDSELDLTDVDFSYEGRELSELLELVKRGQQLYADYAPNASHTFIKTKKYAGENPYQLEQQLEDDIAAYARMLDEVVSLEASYREFYCKKREAEFREQLDMTLPLVEAASTIRNEQAGSPDFLDEKKTESIWYRTLSIVSAAKKSVLSGQKELRAAFSALQEQLKSCNDLPTFQASGTLTYQLDQFDQLQEALTILDQTCAKQAEKSYRSLDLLSGSKSAYSNSDSDRLEQVVDALQNRFGEDGWGTTFSNRPSLQKLISTVQTFVERYKAFCAHAEDLFTPEFHWYAYFNGLSAIQRKIVNALQEKRDWSKAFLQHYLNTLLRQKASGKLPGDDRAHSQLDDSLTELGKEQLRYINDYWYAQQVDAASEFLQKNVNLSVENLYNKRSSERHKRLSLRQIVKHDIDLFSTFFPIILTTPDVASNLFKGHHQYFDIVLFDEASQLRLEDTLPAMLKGKQIVVAGDEHQMPPSNYFSKIFDGTLDDEDVLEDDEEQTPNRDDMLLSCESLLDAATELSFEKRFLDFHYRSRHPALIDFSNHAFYNQRLKPLPNRFDYTPIKFVAVNGTYSEHCNEAEAEAVLVLLEHNIHPLPDGTYPSVGIATFNIAQRNLIKSKIIERQKFKRFESFNDKIVELEKAGLFVKNLENIQGDERDVIILSTTYGINSEGKFAQRFGPINHRKGYKLLNVIITRAKYKVYVCSSIPEEVYLNYKAYLTTEGANNRRAVFFAYLTYAKAVSDHNQELRAAVLKVLSDNSSATTSLDQHHAELESPFEEEVYRALTEHVPEEQVIPQLQFAGFRIDLVYDPKLDNVPKVAIECDGAAYHSSREAYLHDHYRQQILEDHGFVFHRIWSKNWWRNAKRETGRLVAKIREVEAQHQEETGMPQAYAEVFSDDLSHISQLPQVAFNTVDESEVATVVQQPSTPSETQAVLFDEGIAVGSKVKVRYLNSGDELTVQITEGQSAGAGSNGEPRRINMQSALAAALLGAAVGDTVRVGSLDKYVEVLEVVAP